MIDLVFNIGVVWLGLCICMVLIRLIKGPTIFDRILCFDAISVCIIGILVLLSMKWNTTNYIEVILLYSIFGFFGTIVFSYYLFQKYSKDSDEPEDHSDPVPSTIEAMNSPKAAAALKNRVLERTLDEDAE